MQLPSEALVLSTSFTCSVWDDCWSPEQSEGLVQWVEASRRSPAVSDANLSFPLPKLEVAAGIVAASFPKLTESGMPVVVASRAMAAATQATAHNRGHSSFAADWSVDQVALGFPLGQVSTYEVDNF